MGQVPAYELADFGLLMAALEQEWPTRSAALRASGVPLCEGDDDGGSGDDDGSGGSGGGGGDDDGSGGDASKTYDEAYVKKLRDEAAKHRREKAEIAGRLKEYEDQNKTEAERLEERAATAEQRATAAEAASLRLEVALDKAPEGMSIVQVRKLAKRLTGATREELEADAEELFSDFAPDDDDGQEPPRRPRERLRPGAVPGSTPDETDPRKLAAMVPRRSPF